MIMSKTRRPRSFLVAVAVLASVVGAAAPVAAQSATASIIGQTRDESGAVMPGVTVTATSDALLTGSMTAVSDERGEYRITPLPIGTYTVTYELSGFQPVKNENIRLTVGFTARLDMVLKVGSLQESVTVSGQSPVVDVSSTNAATQFTREMLETLPTSRNGLTSLLAQAPGARSQWDVGGGAMTEQPIFRVFGQGGEAWPQVEGVVGGTMGTNGAGNYTDYSAVEEASVSTLGNDAEMPTRGIQIQAIVKSGGNDFHGGGFYDRQPSSLQSNNLDATLKSQLGSGAEEAAGRPIILRYDSGADLGGRILTSKLWFYGAVRRRHDQQAEFGGVMTPSPGPGIPAPQVGDPAVNDQTLSSTTVKLTYQLTQSNKLVGFHQYNSKWDVSEASELRGWESISNKATNSRTVKLEFQSVPTSSIVISAQTGYWSYKVPYYGNTRGPYATTVSPGPSWTDSFSGYVGGAFTSNGRQSDEHSYQQKGSISWYKPDLFAGNHELKAGFDYVDTINATRFGDPGEGLESELNKVLTTYQLVFNNGVADQIRTYNSPTRPNDITHYLGLFVKDQWTIARRLTLNLGVRYAHNPGFVPAGCRDAVQFAPAACWDRLEFNTWNPVMPRLHAAYDIRGNGKMVAKAGWGRFYHMRYPAEVNQVDPNGRTTVTWRWRDLNGNRDYDTGEVNLDPNGTDFLSQSGGSNTIINPEEKEPYQDELSGSYEQEILPGFGIRVTGIHSVSINPYRRLNTLRPPSAYTIGITRPDPGNDGVAGNADDPGVNFTYYEYPTSLRGRAFERFTLTNDADAKPEFNSFEIAASKRLAQGWMLNASISATHRHIPYINGLDPTEQGSSVQLADLDPNAQFTGEDNTWERTGKLAGSYQLPFDVLVAGSYEFRSGEPWARQVQFRGGVTIPTQVLRVEPIGARRLENRHLTNVRLQKSLRYGKGRLDLRANIFNVFNNNTVMQVTKRSGPSFLVPIPDATFPAIMEPRIIALNVAFSF
jgi:hypothetical protein